MDLRLELVLIPVVDVDRAKAFYAERVGFHVDVDTSPAEGMRVVQPTPPGSACSITIGEGLGLGEPGSVRGTHLVVTDVMAAREELAARGVEVSGVRHFDRERPSGGRVPIPLTPTTPPLPTSRTPTGTRGCSRRSAGREQ